MTTAQIISTSVDILLAVAIIVCTLCESRLADWEQRQFDKIKRKVLKNEKD